MFAKKIVKPRLGLLSQGTIFSCALAEDYAGCAVHGLVITARCDIAQSKVPVYNYLPVVKMDDWIHRDGRIILTDRARKRVVGSMKGLLKEAGHSDTILQSETPQAILETLFPATQEKAQRKARDRFEEMVSHLNEIDECQTSHPADRRVVPLGGSFRGERESVIRELTSQRLNGYYFLPEISPDGEERGHVALLREVRHFPRDLAARVGEGLDRDEYKSACNERSDFASRLSFDVDDFAMPVGQIASPDIEHLMQIFAFLFSRVGVSDLDQSYTDRIWDLQPSVGGGGK